MLVRKATLKDSRDVIDMGWALNKMTAGLDEHYTPSKNALQEYKKTYPAWIEDPSYYFFVAEEDGKLAGYVIGKIEEREPIYKVKETGSVIAMFVRERYRKMGVARRLYSALMAAFKNKKITHVQLLVHAKNEAGIAAWRKMGFETDAHLMLHKII